MERSDTERFWVALTALAAAYAPPASARERLIAALAAAAGPLPTSTLVREAGIAKSTASELIAALAGAGAVDVLPDPRDGRRQFVSLQPELAAAVLAREAAAQAALASLPVDDLAAVTDALERIRAALVGEPERADDRTVVAVDNDCDAPSSAGSVGDALLVATSGGDVALPLESVLAVVELERVRPLAGGPAWSLGVAEARGALRQVFDLGARLGGAPSEPRRAVLVRSAGEPLLLAIERALGVHPIASAPSGRDAVGDPLLAGFVEVAGSVVPVLDLQSFGP